MAIERDASSRPRGPYRGFCAQQSIRDIRSARPSSSSRRIIALVWSPLGNPRSRHERVAPAHVQYVRNKPAQKGRRETGGRKRHSELTNVERTKERKGEKKKEKKKRASDQTRKIEKSSLPCEKRSFYARGNEIARWNKWKSPRAGRTRCK